MTGTAVVCVFSEQALIFKKVYYSVFVITIKVIWQVFLMGKAVEVCNLFPFFCAYDIPVIIYYDGIALLPQFFHIVIGRQTGVYRQVGIKHGFNGMMAM